jgi:hypothetical protein
LCRSSQFDSIGDDETDTMVIPGHLVVALLAAIVLFPACAKASGEPGEASNSIQTVASNADVLVAPAGSSHSVSVAAVRICSARKRVNVVAGSARRREHDSPQPTDCDRQVLRIKHRSAAPTSVRLRRALGVGKWTLGLRRLAPIPSLRWATARAYPRKFA